MSNLRRGRVCHTGFRCTTRTTNTMADATGDRAHGRPSTTHLRQAGPWPALDSAPMAAARVRLGVDFGTSNTAAMIHWPDGRARPLLFDGSPLLPSAVYAEPAG